MAATAAVEGVSAAIRFCSVRFGLMITGGWDCVLLLFLAQAKVTTSLTQLNYTNWKVRIESRHQLRSRSKSKQI